MSETGKSAIKLSVSEQTELLERIPFVYTPGYPIQVALNLVGREELLEECMSIVARPGNHIALYGNRGTGKTSLVKVVTQKCRDAGKRVFECSCDSVTTYENLWRSAFKDLKIPSAGESGVGNGKDLGGDEDEPFDRELQSALPEETFVKFGASLIIDVLQRIEDDKVIVVDEFDSLNWKIFDIRLMADTIKQISDSVSDTTIVIVGVATDISELISQQVSIGRNLIHKHVPQMGFDATSEIVSNGLGVLGMTMDTAVQRLIAKFSCGYPYFTHLLSFHACRNAVLRGSKEVVHNPDFISALSRSIEEAEYWLRKAYQDATYDSTKSSYEKVLWACALARIDDVDRPFGPEDIRIHLGRLLLKTVAANTASRYLSALCKGDRGSVLEKCVDGGFRFKDPRLVAFCMMKYEEKRQKSLAKPDDGGGLYPDRDFESEQRH